MSLVNTKKKYEDNSVGYFHLVYWTYSEKGIVFIITQVINQKGGSGFATIGIKTGFQLIDSSYPTINSVVRYM